MGAELRVKETDRIAVMARGLAAVGIRHDVLPDGLHIEGGPLHGATVDSAGDHRVAMSFAIASLRASGPLAIDDTANVATSYPGFAETARSVGLELEEEPAA
jgi:prephenate dehydrogenase/3-phosphoshikimate 1-carboxyvinyltransferase